MIPKKISTMFSHGPEVGVKCSVIRGCLASHGDWYYTPHIGFGAGWILSIEGGHQASLR